MTAQLKSKSILNHFQNWRKWVLPFLLICLVIGIRILPGQRTIDDAFITYRYARNILSGVGFRYNPGESIQGTTTPLYTLLLSGLGLITGRANAPFPLLAVLMNAAADAVTCWMLLKIARKLQLRWAGWAAALYWAAAPFSVTFAVGGLETSLYVMLLTGSVYFLLIQNYPASAWTASLSILTRPDAVLLVGPLILERTRSLFHSSEGSANRPAFQEWIRDALIFSLPLLIWLIYAQLTFGSIIPHSVTAKRSAYLLPGTAALIRLLQHYATPFLGQNLLGTAAIRIGIFLYPFLFVIGAWKSWKTTTRIWPWVLYPWLYLTAFSLGNPLIFRWYLTPPLLPYVFMILTGIEYLIRDLSRALFTNRPAVQNRLVSLLAAGLLFLLPLGFTLQAWESSPDHGPQRPAPEMAYIRLEELYHQAAALVLSDIQATGLNDHQSDIILAAGDVGVLGYKTGLQILDTVGLNSDVSLPYYPLPENQFVINYAVPTNLILDQEPDYLVILEVYGRKTLLQNDTFLEDYQLINKLPTDIYTSRGMLIFKHIDIPSGR